ncbi:glycoside hydrolase family 76 protein [Draconibacterium orientale]|uniref:glycoside hydrolase family 76 protein n=1 Tax=Draconibacterium orientale TaxID=1168034 RepID=UPI002A0A477C|nr:glycoside hydrolase family 76 protein [Draconibacterium orientale]
MFLSFIFELYSSGKNDLFNEYYPYKYEDQATYLAETDSVKENRVAYLWPTSGVFSAVNALFHTTGNEKYSCLLQKKILPGLDNYFDNTRTPVCYQSYISSEGHSDRFYDDNIWLAIDFCDLYRMTGNVAYLQSSEQLWDFVASGWDEQLGGGIYWCEQKKKSKNTCSNAPASVLALKLFEATKDSSYFNRGAEIYHWTKSNLQDTTDFLYFDNIGLNGKVDRRKYSYNSGQMLQASALLYRHTNDKKYLKEAQNIATSAIEYFTTDFTTKNGEIIRLFKNTGSWFNAVLFRGYIELYKLDQDPKFIQIFQQNMDHLWLAVKDKNGLFGKDWSGEKEDEYKWLLDQASLIEIWANLATLK